MREYLERSLTFDEYLDLLDRLLAEGKTTGSNQSAGLLNFAKLNRLRMKRLANTVELTQETQAAAQNAGRKMIWLIITEGWCGDAAQCLPVIEKIAAETMNIETRYVLRDANPELMDGFLTGGARSIPKLIALDAATLETLGTWGARPAAAQELFQKLRSDGIPKAAIMEELQRWYNSDATTSLQEEFQKVIRSWTRMTFPEPPKTMSSLMVKQASGR